MQAAALRGDFCDFHEGFFPPSSLSFIFIKSRGMIPSLFFRFKFSSEILHARDFWHPTTRSEVSSSGSRRRFKYVKKEEKNVRRWNMRNIKIC